MALLLLLSLLSGWWYSVNTTSTTLSGGPLWQDLNIVEENWLSGFPVDRKTTIFCDTLGSSSFAASELRVRPSVDPSSVLASFVPSGYPTDSPRCPQIPPNATDFVQFIGESSKASYWIGKEIVSKSVPTSQPTDIKLEIIDLGVFGQVPPTSNDTGYVVLMAVLDDIYLADAIFLNQYPVLGWNTVSMTFKNHTGTPFSLEVSYSNYGYEGPPIRAVFRGLKLWWV